MTCIVGIEHAGEVWIGGDSAGISNLDVIVRDDEKVFETNGIIFGFTTSFRMGQIIRYGFNCADARDGTVDDRSDMEWLCTTFVDALRSTFHASGWLKSAGGVVSGGQLLLAFKKRLYVVDSDFQVYRPASGYASIGCGSSYALGSLHTSSRVIDLDDDPHERCIWALEASEHMNAGVRAPFTILTTKEKT